MLKKHLSIDIKDKGSVVGFKTENQREGKQGYSDGWQHTSTKSVGERTNIGVIVLKDARVHAQCKPTEIRVGGQELTGKDTNAWVMQHSTKSGGNQAEKNGAYMQRGRNSKKSDKP
jgi:hypothetical protein